jgi:hypothetical protein
MPHPTKLRAHLARLAVLKRRRPLPVRAKHQQATGNSSASIEPSQGWLNNEVEDDSTYR